MEKVVLSTVPSIDTPVCELQTLRFNEEASKLDNTVVITVSMDLPFAFARFCGAKNIENVITASDYKKREFAKEYGLFIEELALISRSVIIIDEYGKIMYSEYVREITEEPNYTRALEALKG